MPRLFCLQASEGTGPSSQNGGEQRENTMQAVVPGSSVLTLAAAPSGSVRVTVDGQRRGSRLDARGRVYPGYCLNGASRFLTAHVLGDMDVWL